MSRCSYSEACWTLNDPDKSVTFRLVPNRSKYSARLAWPTDCCCQGSTLAWWCDLASFPSPSCASPPSPVRLTCDMLCPRPHSSCFVTHGCCCANFGCKPPANTKSLRLPAAPRPLPCSRSRFPWTLRHIDENHSPSSMHPAHPYTSEELNYMRNRAASA